MSLSSLLRPLPRTLEPESMDGPNSASVYDRIAQAHEFLDRLFVRRAVRLGVRSGRALDVGCGSGRLAILMSRALPNLRILGVDTSGPMLQLARRNAREAGVSHVKFLKADGKHLPFRDGTFDLVFSQHTLHHIPAPEALLSEMRRVTRKGGRLFVRDLVRPRCGAELAFHHRLVGQLYNGLGEEAELAKAIYRDSLAAALGRGEWIELARRCGLPASSVARIPLLNHVDIAHRDGSP